MSRLRFNHVFIALTFTAGVCSFIIPNRVASAIRGNIDGLFSPVSSPIRRLAGSISGRLRPERQLDPGDADLKQLPASARDEILELRTSVASLSSQLAQAEEIKASRRLFGNLQDYSTPFGVMGAEGGEGTRQMLMIRGSYRDGLAVSMPVVHRDSVIGKVASVGATGAQVRLVTDPGFRVTGRFVRYYRGKDGQTEYQFAQTPPPLVEGRGDGRMVIMNLSLEDLKDKVQVGDWVVMNEADSDDWPPALNDYLLGQVERILPQKKASWFAEVTVCPRRDPQRLREVMVVTGKPKANATPLAKPVPVKSAPAKASVQEKPAQPAVQKPKVDQRTTKSPPRKKAVG